MKVIIASKNPVKIETTKLGFTKIFPDIEFEFEGVSVPSDVSDQPMTEDETLLGATNRANNAKSNYPDADYWVGLEGGLEETKFRLSSLAYCVVLSKDDEIGRGRTGSFLIPNKLAKLVKEGKELGDASDIVFSGVNLKHSSGVVGKLTKDNITRIKYYEHAVMFALMPFSNKELYAV